MDTTIYTACIQCYGRARDLTAYLTTPGAGGSATVMVKCRACAGTGWIPVEGRWEQRRTVWP